LRGRRIRSRCLRARRFNSVTALDIVKTLLVYESVHHGCTEKVARAMGKALGAVLAKPQDVDAEALGGYDLVGFGSGIYFARHHRSVLELVSRLPRLEKKVFIFSTAGFPPLRAFFHMDLKNRLRMKGANLVGEFCCRGLDTYGPYGIIGGINRGRPGKDELEAAKDFARGLPED